MQDNTTIREAFKILQARSYETALNKGFHDKPRSFGDFSALFHSEITEFFEAMRKGDKQDEHCPDFKNSHIELADVLIRIFDYAGANDIDLAEAIFAKETFNATRAKMHGGKLL